MSIYLNTNLRVIMILNFAHFETFERKLVRAYQKRSDVNKRKLYIKDDRNIKERSKHKRTIEKRGSPENIIIFSHILMKNSPIFFKFSQELYYIMLKQNPVTVCPKSALVHIQKSKRWLLVRLFWASPENHKCKAMAKSRK